MINEVCHNDSPHRTNNCKYSIFLNFSNSETKTFWVKKAKFVYFIQNHVQNKSRIGLNSISIQNRKGLGSAAHPKISVELKMVIWNPSIASLSWSSYAFCMTYVIHKVMVLVEQKVCKMDLDWVKSLFGFCKFWIESISSFKFEPGRSCRKVLRMEFHQH